MGNFKHIRGARPARKQNYSSSDRFRRRGNANSARRRFGGKSIDRALYINDLRAEVQEDLKSYSGVSYSTYNLDERLAKNLEYKNYKITTEIQEKTIPLVLAARDILGISPTGSGKTGAFLIPIIQNMLENKTNKTLVIAPTRELATQILKESISLIRGTSIRATLVVGGESAYRQISDIRRGASLIVGTPGRINDLVKRGDLRLEEFDNVVVDEVDRMFDMGFITDIKFTYYFFDLSI